MQCDSANNNNIVSLSGCTKPDATPSASSAGSDNWGYVRSASPATFLSDFSAVSSFCMLRGRAVWLIVRLRPSMQGSLLECTNTCYDTGGRMLHNNGVCDAAKVWRYAEAGHSLGDYFDDQNPLASRTTVTTGGEIFSVDTNVRDTDPIFSPSLSDSDLIFNFFYGALSCLPAKLCLPVCGRAWLNFARSCLCYRKQRCPYPNIGRTLVPCWNQR